MIIIDSAFWTSVGVTSSDGNADGSQYDFFNYVEMANGETVYNQYDFFKNSEVDGVFYNDHNEWARAVGVLYSESINNITDFYEVATVDGINVLGNQYDFFKSITNELGDTLTSIFNNYNVLNMWSSENILINGTNTTVYDYSGEHDLINPAAANQPSYTSSNASLGGKPSLDFNGTTDYLKKSVSAWRGSDITGVLVHVLKYNSGSQFFGTCDEASTKIINNRIFSSKLNQLHNAGTSYSGSINGSTTVGAGAVKVFASSCDAVSNKVWVNGVDDTATDTIGGGWLGDMAQRDNITVGAAQWSGIGYSNIEWVCSLYMPYTNDADISNVMNELTTYYGI
jgi:hypothetical protein